MSVWFDFNASLNDFDPIPSMLLPVDEVIFKNNETNTRVN